MVIFTAMPARVDLKKTFSRPFEMRTKCNGDVPKNGHPTNTHMMPLIQDSALIQEAASD